MVDLELLTLYPENSPKDLIRLTSIGIDVKSDKKNIIIIISSANSEIICSDSSIFTPRILGRCHIAKSQWFNSKEK